jgi:hypothetical protein
MGVLVGFAGASGGVEADDASGTLRVDADGWGGTLAAASYAFTHDSIMTDPGLRVMIWVGPLHTD